MTELMLLTGQHGDFLWVTFREDAGLTPALIGKRNMHHGLPLVGTGKANWERLVREAVGVSACSGVHRFPILIGRDDEVYEVDAPSPPGQCLPATLLHTTCLMTDWSRTVAVWRPAGPGEGAAVRADLELDVPLLDDILEEADWRAHVPLDEFAWLARENGGAVRRPADWIVARESSSED